MNNLETMQIGKPLNKLEHKFPDGVGMEAIG